MDEYLKTLQSISQSIEQALQNLQISTEEKKFANHLSNSVQLCVNKIGKSANTLKKIVDVSLEDLNNAEIIWKNYYKISREVSPLTPLEEIGKLSGHYSKILRLIEDSRKEVFEQLKDSWEQEFENNTKEWFIDKEGKIKKGIGWNQKDGFVKKIKDIKPNQYVQLEQALKKKYKIIFDELTLLIDFNSVDFYLIIFEQKLQEKYQNDIKIIWKKIQNSLESLKIYSKPMQDFRLNIKCVLEPIINSKWGDLPWDLVVKTKLKYIDEIEKNIMNIFLEQAQLITSLFEVIIKIHNEFLQKQIFYNQQSPEEQQGKQEWINIQRQKLETLQNSLEIVINFQL